MTQATKIISNLSNLKEQKDKSRFKAMSEGIHKLLIENEADALEAELLLNQMATNYATVAKKHYIIKDDKQKP